MALPPLTLLGKPIRTDFIALLQEKQAAVKAQRDAIAAAVEAAKNAGG